MLFYLKHFGVLGWYKKQIDADVETIVAIKITIALIKLKLIEYFFKITPPIIYF
jgi:hypothetical protein